jgi:hypothetical protein
MRISPALNNFSNRLYQERIGPKTDSQAVAAKTSTAVSNSQNIPGYVKSNGGPNTENAVNRISRDGDRLTISKLGLETLRNFNITVPQGAMVVQTPSQFSIEGAIWTANQGQGVQRGASGGASTFAAGSKEVESSSWSDDNSSGSTISVTDTQTGINTTQTKTTDKSTGETTKDYTQRNAEGKIIRHYTEILGINSDNPDDPPRDSNFDRPGMRLVSQAPNAYDKRREVYDGSLIVRDPAEGITIYSAGAKGITLNLLG